MKKVPDPQSKPYGSAPEDPLVDEALAWLVHLHSGEEAAGDWEKFQDWKTFDEAHQHAAQRAEKLWERLGPALLKARKGKKSRDLPVLFAALVGFSAIAFALGLFGPPASFFADYQSAIGQIRTVSLEDGSQVDLDTGTSFDVSDGGRTITLYSGQIFVSVRPNPDRSFVVKTGATHVQALGTAFAVRRDGNDGSVVVTEHAVRVTGRRNGQHDYSDVAAGEKVNFSGSRGVGKPQPVDAKQMTAWRKGELIFNGRPLGEVVSELERYRRGRIFILDAALGRLPVTGSFSLRDSDDFLESLQLALPVRILKLPGVVLITARNARG